MTFVTLNLLFNLELFGYASSDFFESEFGFQTQISTAVLLRSSRGTATTETAKTSEATTAKDVTEVWEDVVDVGKSATKSSSSCTTFKSCFTKLVIALSLLGVAQYLVGFCRFLKLLFSFLVTRVFIWVIFHSYLTVSLLDLSVTGTFVDTEYLIVV